MSCDLMRKIKCSEKANSIVLNVAVNNVRPLYFTEWNYRAERTELSYRDKQILLMKDFLDGCIHVCQLNSSTIPYMYALIKVKEFVNWKGKNLYEDYYRKCGNDLHEIFSVYGELFPIWKAALKENDMQDCILGNGVKWVCWLGNFDYRAYFGKGKTLPNRCSAKKMSYKKAYIVRYSFNLNDWKIEKF